VGTKNDFDCFSWRGEVSGETNGLERIRRLHPPHGQRKLKPADRFHKGVDKAARPEGGCPISRGRVILRQEWRGKCGNQKNGKQQSHGGSARL
jgi:hypothetical protein